MLVFSWKGIKIWKFYFLALDKIKFKYRILFYSIPLFINLYIKNDAKNSDCLISCWSNNNCLISCWSNNNPVISNHCLISRWSNNKWLSSGWPFFLIFTQNEISEKRARWRSVCHFRDTWPVRHSHNCWWSERERCDTKRYKFNNIESQFKHFCQLYDITDGKLLTDQDVSEIFLETRVKKVNASFEEIIKLILKSFWTRSF